MDLDFETPIPRPRRRTEEAEQLPELEIEEDAQLDNEDEDLEHDHAEANAKSTAPPSASTEAQKGNSVANGSAPDPIPILPASRIARIAKALPGAPKMSREALQVVNQATVLFLRELTEGADVANRSRGCSTIVKKDIVRAIQTGGPRMAFLMDCLEFVDREETDRLVTQPTDTPQPAEDTADEMACPRAHQTDLKRVKPVKAARAQSARQPGQASITSFFQKK